MVNVPEYRLRWSRAGNVVHQTRVIVGKEQSQTPIFSENMKYLVVNPSWTIPPSIMKKEILPALANDPYYAARKGYKIIRRGNRISVQQPPGERNALGFVKFMFPNQHAVYLHDTPNRNLFSAGKRAFSHGCVRVDKPFELAEEIMGKDGKWTEEKLRGLIGKGERYVNLHQSPAGSPDLLHPRGRREGRGEALRRYLRPRPQGPRRPEPVRIIPFSHHVFRPISLPHLTRR